MSDTPRTGAQITGGQFGAVLVGIDFARQLERELAQAQRAGEELADALREMIGQYGDGSEVGWRKRMHDGARAALAQWEEAKK